MVNNKNLWLWVLDLRSRCSLVQDDDGELSMSQPLLIEHDDGVDRVTLNRPDSLNALDPALRAFLEKRKPVYIKR